MGAQEFDAFVTKSVNILDSSILRENHALLQAFDASADSLNNTRAYLTFKNVPGRRKIRTKSEKYFTNPDLIIRSYNDS